jgi:hypothetical protein
VQDLPLLQVAAGLQEPGDPSLQLQQPLIAGGQGTNGNQDAAQVRNRLAGRHLVEDLVGQRPLITAEIAEQRPDLRPASQPVLDGGGPLHRGQGVMQRGQALADMPGATAEQIGDAAAQAAPLAGRRAQLPRLLADRAAVPEAGIGVAAARAQWRGPGSRIDRLEGAAAGAAGPVPAARLAPRLAGGLGDLTPSCLPAQEARYYRHGPATAAPRPVRSARRDRAQPPAAGAYRRAH